MNRKRQERKWDVSIPSQPNLHTSVFYLWISFYIIVSAGYGYGRKKNPEKNPEKIGWKKIKKNIDRTWYIHYRCTNTKGMLRHAIFVVGCLWLFLVVHPTHSQEFNASEYSALKDLYDSTRGEYWRWHGVREHWDFSDPQPCLPTPWQGLTCVPSNTNIQEITLILYNLSGTLLESLGNLSKLQEFDLSFNGITGSLPE